MTLPRTKTLVYFALSLALFAVAVFWVGAETSRVMVQLPLLHAVIRASFEETPHK